MIVIACPDEGVGTDPEALGLAFHHQGPTFILIEKLHCSWCDHIRKKVVYRDSLQLM